MTDLLKKTSNSLIYHEQPERIAHSCSFFMSDLSDLLTVTHLSWTIWANCSESLIWSEQSEQMSKWANERWGNEGIPKPWHIKDKYLPKFSAGKDKWHKCLSKFSAGIDKYLPKFSVDIKYRNIYQSVVLKCTNVYQSLVLA